MSNKRLIKSTGMISLATLLSRVLGFARDILMAKFFGTSLFAEAFVVSFRIPNLLRDLVGEGAANAAFVPVLTEYRATRSKKEFWHLAKDLLYVLMLILFVISLCGVMLAPLIVKAIAPGFASDPEKLAITINLTRLMFPFIFLVGLVAYGMGVLNSLNHFTVPAFGPVLLNIAMIAFLVYFMMVSKVSLKAGIMWLGVAVLVGGALQVLAMGIVLRKKGLRLEKGFFIHPAIKKIWWLLIPRLFGSAVYQLSVIVSNIFSTFEHIVGAGAPAALWYSYRLFHLPLAIFGVSLATVALPRMSGEVARHDMAAFKDTINFSMRSVFLVLVPAGIGLATMGEPIVKILFERGEFTSYSTFITNNALFFYSFGLFACGGIKILVNAFFSLGDTMTPVKAASLSFFLNLVLNYALMWPLKVGGLALANSIAATFNFVVLYALLKRRIGDMGTGKILNSFNRILIAGALMGIFSYAAGRFLLGLNKGFLLDSIGMSLIILLSAAIYLLACLALGIDEVKRLIKWVSKRN